MNLFCDKRKAGIRIKMKKSIKGIVTGCMVLAVTTGVFGTLTMTAEAHGHGRGNRGHHSGNRQTVSQNTDNTSGVYVCPNGNQTCNYNGYCLTDGSCATTAACLNGGFCINNEDCLQNGVCINNGICDTYETAVQDSAVQNSAVQDSTEQNTALQNNTVVRNTHHSTYAPFRHHVNEHRNRYCR